MQNYKFCYVPSGNTIDRSTTPQLYLLFNDEHYAERGKYDELQEQLKNIHPMEKFDFTL